MIKVFVLDDHEFVRRGLSDVISAQPDMVVVGESATLAEAHKTVNAVQPDVAVLDLRLPDGNGIEFCRDIRVSMPDVICLILTSFDDQRAALGAAMAGASGYLIKDIRGADFVDVIRRAAAGERMLDVSELESEVSEALLLRGADPLEELTPQERTLLTHLAAGMTNRQIASQMFLAEKTVKNYVSNLLMKLGMSRRTEAAVFAVRLSERQHIDEY